MKKYTITLFVIVLFSNCKQTTPKQVINSKSKEDEFTIDTFSTFPPEIDGCSCYFSNDSIYFKNKAYIYMNDYAQTSFVKINGILTKFIENDHIGINDTTTIINATSANYDMTIELDRYIQLDEELVQRMGTIKITDKRSGKSITKAFYGECGC